MYDYVGRTVIEQEPNIFKDPGKDGLSKETYASYITIYEQAIEFEEKSIDLYGELARQAKSEGERDAFRLLEREEEVHRALLWRILQLLQRPEEWYPYI